MSRRLECDVLQRLEAGLPMTRRQCISLHFLAASRKVTQGNLHTIGFHVRGIFRALFIYNHSHRKGLHDTSFYS